MMLDEDYEELWDLNAPLTDEDFAAFGLDEYNLDQINQGSFTTLYDLDMEEHNGEPGT